jgi:LacI family transcriptional regulator
MKKKDITIYDIAQQLSLSSSTVSRALQDHPSIKKKTKQKVVNKAKELGYRYNHFAGSLRKQKTNTIGFLVHELNSSFITSVLSGIEKITTAAGYNLLIAHSSESFKKEIANAQNFFNQRVDGLIASLTFETENLNHFNLLMTKEYRSCFLTGLKRIMIITLLSLLIITNAATRLHSISLNRAAKEL